VPDTFVFGGVRLPAGLLKIDKTTTDADGNKVIGTRANPKHITRAEVEALVRLCPDLTRLVLDFCYLDDYTPLGKLTNLTELSLMTCGDGFGYGVLTDISWISSLTELERLNLCYNEIEDITPISELYGLTYINLAGNDLEDDDLDALSGLFNVTNLALYYLSNLTDVSALAEMQSLSYLHLGFDKNIKSVKPLTKLKNLSRLRLNETGVEDLSYFGSFKKLERLDLSACSRKASAYQVLESCPKLKSVAIANAPDDVKAVFAAMSSVTLCDGWDGSWNY
jgi:internalin A